MLYHIIYVFTRRHLVELYPRPSPGSQGGFIPGGGEKSEARAERIERELGLVAGGLGGREAGARDGPGQSSRKKRCEVQMEL